MIFRIIVRKMNVINRAGQNKPKLILICRLCGEPSDSYINIFGDEGTAHSLSNKIFSYLNLEVSSSDLLPKILCNKCFNKLEEFHNFFLASEKVQLSLMSAINDSNKFSIMINIGSLKNEVFKENFSKLDKANTKNVSFIYDKDKATSNTIKAKSISYSNKDLEDDKLNIFENYNNSGDKETLPFNILDDYDFDYQEILDFIDGKNKDQNIFEMTDKKDENSRKENSFVQSNMTDILFTDNSSNNNIHNNINCNDANMLLSSESANETKTDLLTEFGMKENSSESLSVFQENDVMEMLIRLPCLSCKEVCMKPKELIDHFKQNHCNETPVFKCRICGSLNKNLKKFFMHYQNHKNIKYTCKICGKSFARQWTLQLHAAVHTDIKYFNCDQCEKSFKYVNTLREHRKVHLPDECKQMYNCADCGKSFKSRFLLTSHRKNHTGQKDFACEICNKFFFSKSLLHHHMAIHNFKKNIKCHLCHKLFQNETLLERHLSKSFKCEYCVKQYCNLSLLKQHGRLHTGELPYKCESCPKRFRLKIALTTHERQHTGVKPFECRTCDHAFTDFANFNKHMKRKHNKTNVVERNDELICLKI